MRCLLLLSVAFPSSPLMSTVTLEVNFPQSLALHARSRAEMEARSRFLMALKYFELGEVTSGQASAMCGMGRVAFLAEAARCGVPAVELADEDLSQEFANG
jgi:hypothetical protein